MRCCTVCLCSCVKERDCRSWITSRDALQNSAKQKPGACCVWNRAEQLPHRLLQLLVGTMRLRAELLHPSLGARRGAATCCFSASNLLCYTWHSCSISGCPFLCVSVCLKCWFNKTCADLRTANVKIWSKNPEKRSSEMNHKRQKRCFECKPFSILGALSCFSKRVLNFFAIFRLTCSIWCLWHYWAPGKITI